MHTKPSEYQIARRIWVARVPDEFKPYGTSLKNIYIFFKIKKKHEMFGVWRILMLCKILTEIGSFVFVFCPMLASFTLQFYQLNQDILF